MTTKTMLWFLRIGPMLLILFALLESPVSADAWTTPALTVHLASGGQLTGQPDPRSGGDWLWLRVGRPSAYVVRPIAWDHVVRAMHGAEAVSVEQLRGDIQTLEGIVPQASDAELASGVLPEPMSPLGAAGTSAERPAAADFAPAPRRPVPPGRLSRVASIRADAWAANWDADVEQDGIVVQVLAFDSQGYSVPVSGRLEVVLVGPRARRINESARNPSVRFGRLGQWSRRVEPQDMSDAGMTYRLPYQVTHPEFDTRLGSHALVHVRLAVPGSGMFERTIDYVRVQPFSPLRDYQQLHTGRRWLDIEQTGRRKQGPPD